LVETEGLYAFSSYIESLARREKKSRAILNLLNNKNVVIAKQISDEGIRLGYEHPKVEALLGILAEYRDKSIIVFAQYRSSIKMLVEQLSNHGYNARPFVGKKKV